MELATKRCPNCGAELQVDDSLRMGRCLYCESTFIIEDNNGGVPSAAPQVGNNDPAFKFAVAEKMANTCLTNGINSVKYRDKIGYDAVYQYYTDAQAAGADSSSEFWVHFCRFQVRAFEEGLVAVKSKKEFMNSTGQYMDYALKYAPDSEKLPIIMEKQAMMSVIKSK